MAENGGTIGSELGLANIKNLMQKKVLLCI